MDFSKAELSNIRWHRRLSLILSELACKEFRELRRLELLRHLTYLNLPGLRSEPGGAWEHHQKAASELLSDYANELLELTPQSEAERRKTAMQALQGAWEKAYGGSMTDPEIQAKIDQVAESLRRQRQGS